MTAPIAPPASPTPGRFARLLRALFGPLPPWARTDHPLMRYTRPASPVSRRARLARAFAGVALLAVLVMAAALVATAGFTRPAGDNPAEGFHAIAYFPLIALGLLSRTAAFFMTVSAVGDEARRQTWEPLRTTERGVSLLLRARWASIFYRLRGLLALNLGVRAVMLLILLWDLTAFQGRYIDLLLSGIVPDVPVPLGILLLAALMTAAMLLPLTHVGFDAALGLLVGTQARGRTTLGLTQFAFMAVRAAFTVGLLVIATRFFGGRFDGLSDPAAWAFLFLLAALADGGLAFLLLSRFGELWAVLPYGVFISGALLVFTLVQAFAADQVLAWAARRAQAKE
jgi:hypothetical protein